MGIRKRVVDEHAEDLGIGGPNMDGVTDFSWAPDPDKGSEQEDEGMETSPVEIDYENLANSQG